jgi:hypothetical protein
VLYTVRYVVRKVLLMKRARSRINNIAKIYIRLAYKSYKLSLGKEAKGRKTGDPGKGRYFNMLGQKDNT